MDKPEASPIYYIALRQNPNTIYRIKNTRSTNHNKKNFKFFLKNYNNHFFEKKKKKKSQTPRVLTNDWQPLERRSDGLLKENAEKRRGRLKNVEPEK